LNFRVRVVGGQFRLLVEGVDVRHAARREEEDDPVGLRREVPALGGQRIFGASLLKDEPAKQL
jgi:hypothetical protein